MTLAEKFMQAEMEKQAGRMADAKEAVIQFARNVKGGAGPQGRVAGSPLTPLEAQYDRTVRNARITAGVGGAALLGGGALALKKLMAKKSLGQRLVGAMKKNRRALIGGGAAAGGLAGLAAYKKSQK